MFNCYTCNHGHARDMNMHRHNTYSQTISCCEHSGQTFCSNRNYHRNESSTPIYGTIGNGKNNIKSNMCVN